jgi:nucleoside 2-deoxyribosyltransferase
MDLAYDLAKRIERAGIRVLMPKENFNDDQHFAGKINNDLRKADEVIFILTNNSIHSQRLLFEMGFAASLEKPLTPILQGVDPSELPPVIREMQYIKYSDLDSYIARLQSNQESSKSAKLTKAQ